MGLLRSSAARGTAVLFAALVFAGLLDARGLRKQAQTQPQGSQRQVALALTSPLLDVSRALHLTAPRQALQSAIGRPGEDTVDTRVRLESPPPVGPLHRPLPRPPSAAPRKPTFTAARPLRVWVAGDSLAQVPGEGLGRVARDDIDVVGIESRLSTGLARPDLYNWFTRFTHLLRAPRPDVAVLSFGADDAHDYLAGVPAGRTIGAFGSPSWLAEYRRRVDGVTAELQAAGIRTIWIGLPITDGLGFRHSFAVVNRVLAEVAKAHEPHAHFLDTWHLLDSAHGTFTPYLRVHGKLTLMRLADGVHYTAAAGDLIATQLLALLHAEYSLR